MTRLSFNFLPHRREFLETTIGMKMRNDFAFNSFTPIPKVRLFTPQEAIKAGFDPGKGLGWFNFKTNEIGILVFDDVPANIAWQNATGIAIHEHLHWLWSLSPKTVGCQTEAERFVMNVFTDGANEQRAALESRWAQKFLRRTRALLLPEVWAGDVTEPLYRAGFFTLAVHTLLMVKGTRILRKIHKSGQPENMAKELWSLCEKEFNRKIPENELELWLKAFALTLKAWTTDSDFTRFDIAQEFIALFPPPQAKPPEMSSDMGGHLNGEFQRREAPAGRTPNGKRIASKNSASSDKDDSSNGESNSGDPGKSESNDSSSGNHNQDEGNDNSPLSFDSDAGDGGEADDEQSKAEEKRELDEVEQEVTELNSPSKSLPGAIVTRSVLDLTHPKDPRNLVKNSASDASVLAERLRVVSRPRGREKSSKGRVVSRIVAFDPTAAKPFRNRTAMVKGFAPRVYMAFVIDTSGSMRSNGKMEAARRAGMTVHLACVQEKVAHLITTSRSLEQLAGMNLSSEKGNALIAGLTAHRMGGDNYLNTLNKLIDHVVKRPEEIKVLMVLTDGNPGDKDKVRKHVEFSRQKGVITIGVGLKLNPDEIEGMKYIFGEKPEQLVITGTDGFAKLTAEVLSNAVTRGNRASILTS